MVRRGAHLRLRLKVDDRMTAQAGDTTQLKRALRRQLRSQRARIPAPARLRAAQRATAVLVRTRIWRQAQHVDGVPALGPVEQQLAALDRLVGQLLDQEQRGAVELGGGAGAGHVSDR